MKAAILLLLVACAAQAEVVGVFESMGGGHVDIRDDAQACVGQAKSALFTGSSGLKVPGCWITDGRSVRIVFLDGDVLTVPIGIVKKPTQL